MTDSDGQMVRKSPANDVLKVPAEPYTSDFHHQWGLNHQSAESHVTSACLILLRF